MIRNILMAFCIFGILAAFTTKACSASPDGVRIEEREGTTSHGHFKSKKTYRNNVLIMQELWKAGSASRVFYQSGNPTWGESDDNGDGFMERMMIWSSDGQIVEAFIRDKSGEVSAVSNAELKRLRAENEQLTERMREALEQ